MGSRSIPQADILAVAKSSRLERKPILKFAPPIGLSCVNYQSLGGIDQFYLDCQNHRDYYRDPVDKVHRPPRFCLHPGPCGILPDRNIEMLKAPINWVREPQPVVYPEKYNTRLRLDGGIRIAAHFWTRSAQAYTR
ncbi:uncharacterized protein LOC6567662 [Drosophila grimshawi]|uniref:GH19560 n=1 Tax=Drosophila grimshawi TaxID=7222 RepID=B4JRT1_DROGR|nr:uncharacterized protein LOC6567662 [Drosophila grimshawi]EDV94471.1 GH19560 [Drosophila grimshawi]